MVRWRLTNYRAAIPAYCLLLIAYCSFAACSVPNLEDPECDQARDVVREFYSLHFASDMALSAEGLEKKKAYLTSRLYDSLKGAASTVDPFTRTSDLPKAFRAGECRVIESGTRTAFNILLFWKTDTRSEQRSINVTTAKVDGTWRIDAIDDAPPSDLR